MTPAAPVLEVRKRATKGRKMHWGGRLDGSEVFTMDKTTMTAGRFVIIVVLERKILCERIFVGTGGLLFMCDEVEICNRR